MTASRLAPDQPSASLSGSVIRNAFVSGSVVGGAFVSGTACHWTSRRATQSLNTRKTTDPRTTIAKITPAIFKMRISPAPSPAGSTSGA
jgi:hypothetical protein